MMWTYDRPVALSTVLVAYLISLHESSMFKEWPPTSHPLFDIPLDDAMSVAMMSSPEQGQLISVRSRNWIVNEVVPSTLPTSGLQGIVAPQTLVSLASVEDDGLGEEIQVVWELELGARIIEKVALPDPTGFDPPDQLNAFLDAVRWGASSLADVRNIQSPFRSGIDIEDYQLDPVVRAIQMPRVNLLIADDVGLGKTIEAGMVALELIIRHRARKILIVCPSSLQIQWQEQMRDKFGLDFRIVSSELMRDLRRQRGIHVNPWNHFPRLITSIDFLKRERPLRMFREILPGPNDPIYPRKFDLLITDEAHNCAPSGRGKYATDSLRTKALRLLAPHFEHKLFLTATPHNGYPESFSALLELLDNQRFARGTKPDRKQLDAVMVRRMKSELPTRWDGSPRFPKSLRIFLLGNTRYHQWYERTLSTGRRPTGHEHGPAISTDSGSGRPPTPPASRSP